MTSTLLLAAALTDRGRLRPRNEDAFALDVESGIGVVADGMGGHPGGDVASDIAARTTMSALRDAVAEPWPPEANGSGAARDEAMRASVLRAHEAIRARGREEIRLSGMGTTATALVLDARARRFSIVHVGDSRAYRLRDGRLDQLTRDDTWVQERVEAGMLSAEEAERHPMRHLLTQCLGLDETPRPAVHAGAVEDADAFLLCSDGLVACLTPSEIRTILTDELDGTEDGARKAVEALVAAANRAGGVDNITALVMTPAPASLRSPPPPGG